MGRQRVTIRDVADAANVSLTAVSFYLNNKPGLSDDTRDRIADVIQRLGYTPRNPAGVPAGLGFIGLLIERLPLSPFADMFYGDVIQGIEDRARSLQYNVALMTVEAGERLPHLLEQHGGSLAGLVLLGGGEVGSDVIENVHSEGIPAILVDHDDPGPLLNSVMPDYVRGAYDATNYLLEKGYRRIAFIQGPAKYRSLVERYHGYTLALLDAGLPLDSSLVQPSISSGVPNKGYREMKALLENRGSFDAIFCVTDRTAIGVMEALREAHIRVPDDIAVMGFDNVAQSSHMSPPLTTVDVSKRALGVKAIDLLHRQIVAQEEFMPVKTLLPTRLIRRNSA